MVGADGPSAAALIIVDMLNDRRLAPGASLPDDALPVARVIARLRDEARRRGVPAIFVNDGFGLAQADRGRLFDRAVADGGAARALAETLRPTPQDHFIVKPQFSGFYATGLSGLLARLGARRLILTGIATDICVLFSAADAHMRGYRLWVPHDAATGTNAERHAWALELMRQSMAAETRPTAALPMADWLISETGAAA